MRISVDSDLQERIRRMLDELESSMEDRWGLTDYRLMCEMNNRIADLIEEWTSSSMNELLGKDDARGVAETVAKIHKAISGANEVTIRADPRGMVMNVRGCPRIETCALKGRTRWCMPDMIVAAIIQRAMETPVRMSIDIDEGRCIHDYKPAWLVELLANLDTFGAEGMVVLHGDRVLFSHLPSEEHAEALSESVLINEESGRELAAHDIYCRNRKIMMMRFGRVFVSVCLSPEGADEGGIREYVARAIKKVELA